MPLVGHRRTGAGTRRVGPVVNPHLTRLAVLTLLALLMPTVPADAQPPPRTTSREPLVDGLRHETFVVTLDDGAVARGNLVRVARTPTLRVEPVHAGGRIPGTITTSTMARRELPRGGLAVVNGGFWLPAAGGKPHGVAASNRRLLTGPRTHWGHPGHRGTLGVRADGSALFSRLGGELRLQRPGQPGAAIDDLNSVPLKVGGDGTGELLAYTSAWGRPVAPPRGATVAVLDGLRLPVLGAGTGIVRSVGPASGDVRVPGGGAVLVAYGRARERLADLAVGGTAKVRVAIDPIDIADEAWVEAVDVLPGGPFIVRDGRMTPPDDWQHEGFPHDRHNGPRHPRTAIAALADGTLLLVTVDGRQAHSAGMTMWELADLLIDLGAEHGLSLDGGGSTTLTTLGRIRNRFSDPVERPVASFLSVRYLPSLPVRDPATTACPGARVPDPGFRDIAGNAHHATIRCQAWYGITTGVTVDRYAAGRAVTRAQMASFLVRLVDHAVAHPGRGRAARALPDAGPGAFADVARRSPHAEAIGRLAAAGIVGGGPGRLPASRFGPGRPISRAQMASLLDRTLTHVRGRALADGSDVFADDNRSTHRRAIGRLAQTGVAQGRSPGLFAPGDDVSRAAMASFVMRTAEILAAAGTTTPPR